MSIIAGYVPTSTGQAVLAAAAAQAVAFEAPLRVISLIPNDVLADPRRLTPSDRESLENQISHLPCRAVLEVHEARDIAGWILRAAHEPSTTLVVIGVRRRTPVGKALMGSVAQRLILDSPVPVLAIKSSRSH